ncbi:homodimeric pyruvate:ferredoxin (flavodoxin) oxidoreductase [Aminicella lysinilytica]|uniref:Homodimeric pyruvate:ferredoxin (Flavodoxin) oxidoreductase n=1 Tax=Aminicella lysinilytica TaxID=433323 RepID=A0A4R6Q321_9FIRM|nr:homodimeric pyruvate:ferredoxin (flavodoxin) oxidoreductase [Aminicella lysinilytica]
MIMQAAFFELTKVIPVDDAIKYLKEGIQKTYKKKGQLVVDMNCKAVDKGIDAIEEVNVPHKWLDAPDSREKDLTKPEYVDQVMIPVNSQEGDDLPVSSFLNLADGTFPLGTSRYEKRGVAVHLPHWDSTKCIQCNQCSFICPHSAVRPYLLTEDETADAPEGFETIKAQGKALENYRYRMQVSALDCMGCGNCADICPAKESALTMSAYDDEVSQADNWDYAQTLSRKDIDLDKKSVKGSQFRMPYFEFSGACAGCGETPYMKVLTQLFGDRMMIANATGCSSIWGASAPSIPFCKDDQGRGPAWANSLFEDNAEFGYGMAVATKQLREKIEGNMRAIMELDIDDNLKDVFREWLEYKDNGEESRRTSNAVVEALENIQTNDEVVLKIAERILRYKDFLVKKSIWSVGGDGWAYDIGYGGLDHVLASGEDINVLVFDTEVYSNTGGQSSKATPAAAVAKFAASGKKIKKKDLGKMAMAYGYVYVAQVGIGADKSQFLKAITEAEAFNGPSLIIAYAPCINHGIKKGMGKTQENIKDAVSCGYWSLYRYNPDLSKKGRNPFILDSKEPTASFQDFIMGQTRYLALAKEFPTTSDQLFKQTEMDARKRYEEYKKMAEE